MPLTTTQETTLANALKAETKADVVDAMAIRNDVALTNWCNAASTSDAWNNSMSGSDLFQASDVTKFDGLTAGKRDAWRMMLDFAPIDCAKNANRKALQDVWGNTDSVAVLQSCTRKATNAEKYLGGTSATTNTVAALKLDFVGQLAIYDVSMALNRN
jgi:hypothetical protein